MLSHCFEPAIAAEEVRQPQRTSAFCAAHGFTFEGIQQEYHMIVKGQSRYYRRGNFRMLDHEWLAVLERLRCCTGAADRE